MTHIVVLRGKVLSARPGLLIPPSAMSEREMAFAQECFNAREWRTRHPGAIAGGAWDAADSATQLTTVDNSTEEFFDDVPILNPGETFHVDVTVNSSGTTDDAIIAAYGSLQGTPDYDEVPLTEFRIDATAGTDQKGAFHITGFYQFRVGVLSTGATDTFTADMDSRGDGISL